MLRSSFSTEDCFAFLSRQNCTVTFSNITDAAAAQPSSSSSSSHRSANNNSRTSSNGEDYSITIERVPSETSSTSCQPGRSGCSTTKNGNGTKFSETSSFNRKRGNEAGCSYGATRKIGTTGIFGKSVQQRSIIRLPSSSKDVHRSKPQSFPQYDKTINASSCSPPAIMSIRSFNTPYINKVVNPSGGKTSSIPIQKNPQIGQMITSISNPATVIPTRIQQNPQIGQTTIKTTVDHGASLMSQKHIPGNDEITMKQFGGSEEVEVGRGGCLQENSISSGESSSFKLVVGASQTHTNCQPLSTSGQVDPTSPASALKSKKRPRSINFSTSETFDLLKLWVPRASSCKMRILIRKTHRIWDNISFEMSRIGHYRTPAQCRTRVYNLVQDFYRIKLHGKGLLNFPYYKQIAEVLDERNAAAASNWLKGAGARGFGRPGNQKFGKSLSNPKKQFVIGAGDITACISQDPMVANCSNQATESSTHSNSRSKPDNNTGHVADIVDAGGETSTSGICMEQDCGVSQTPTTATCSAAVLKKRAKDSDISRPTSTCSFASMMSASSGSTAPSSPMSSSSGRADIDENERKDAMIHYLAEMIKIQQERLAIQEKRIRYCDFMRLYSRPFMDAMAPRAAPSSHQQGCSSISGSEGTGADTDDLSLLYPETTIMDECFTKTLKKWVKKTRQP